MTEVEILKAQLRVISDMYDRVHNERDELRARIAELEAKRDEANGWATFWRDQANGYGTLEADLARVEKERDEWKLTAERESEGWQRAVERGRQLEAAEARVTELKT